MTGLHETTPSPLTPMASYCNLVKKFQSLAINAVKNLQDRVMKCFEKLCQSEPFQQPQPTHGPNHRRGPKDGPKAAHMLPELSEIDMLPRPISGRVPLEAVNSPQGGHQGPTHGPNHRRGPKSGPKAAHMLPKQSEVDMLTRPISDRVLLEAVNSPQG